MKTIKAGKLTDDVVLVVAADHGVRPQTVESIKHAKDANVDLEEAVANMNIDHSWMEAVDNALWSHELILLRLTNAVQKKKGAKILGERIAKDPLELEILETEFFLIKTVASLFMYVNTQKI